MPPARLVALLICLMAPAAPALAWGPPGHEIVGELAERQLRPGARSEVDRLLAGEARPSLAGVANWADALRETETGRVRTSGWHFINFRGGACEYVPPRDCPDGNCIIGAINRQFLLLADRRRPDSERRDALKFLVHLIADIHQPLHASWREDHGGNDFQVAYRGQGRNLHSVWDGLIVRQAWLPVPEYARQLHAQSPLPPDPSRRSDRPAVDWAIESCKLITSADLYPRKHVVDVEYLAVHRALAETRLRLAASRLAGMLNYALDPRTASAAR